jgi:hypothetical protein
MKKAIQLITKTAQNLFLLLLVLFSVSAIAQVTQNFTASGSWKAPSGVSTVTVRCWGGGGGGGGAANTNNYAGGGGGGGAFATSNITVTGGTTYTVTVGAGGTAGATNSAGGVGGDSWFSTSTAILAKGGGGGTHGTAATVGNGARGLGGTAASSIGTTKYDGGNGANGNATTANGTPGGGGGGAGTGGAGNPASEATGGAARADNGGAGGNGSSAANGGAGSNYGGGGAGGGKNKTGGTGAPGFVTLSYTCPATPVLAAPTANAATAIGCNGFTANWTAVTGNISYKLDVSTSSTFATFIHNGLDVGNVTSYVLTGLSGGTTYHYRVRANDGCNGIFSNTINLTTTLCYCTATGTSNTVGYITKVSFNTINRTSAHDAYINTGLTTSVEQGATYLLSMTRFNTSTYNNFTAAWIDWNRDGAFSAEEEVLTNLGQNANGELTRTASITIPTSAAIGTVKMRVRLNYNAAAPACGTTTYGDVEDYDINILAGSNMTFVSSTVTQASTANVAQGATGAEIVRLEVVTTGAFNPLTLNTLTFNTTGSTNAVNDITRARIYYTGTSSTLNFDNPVGSEVIAPSGTHAVTVSQVLSAGTNYFWVTYNIKTTATINNVVDAQVTTFNLAGTNRTPTVTNPAGTRPIVATTVGAYCAVTGSGTGNYITNVAVNDINNTTTNGCANNYCNYTNISTTMYLGQSYSIIVDAFGSVKSGSNCWAGISVYVDFNGDGDFNDPDETIHQSSANTAAAPWDPYRIESEIIVPLTAKMGSTRMRVVTRGASTTGPPACGTLADAEIEDYTINIIEAPVAQYLGARVTQNTDTVVAGTFRQQIIGIEIDIIHSVNPFTATQFVLNTTGTTNVANIKNARLYFTGSDDSYSSANQFGVTTIAAPSGTFTLTGSALMSPGTNYFWLAYDIDINAPTGNCVDAQCTQITINNGAATNVVPSPTAPAGCRPILAATNMIYMSCTTTQNTSRVAKGEVNQHVVGVEIVTVNALNPLSTTSFTFNTAGTTNVGDISNARLWYSGNTSAYPGSTQIGNVIAAPNGTFTINIAGGQVLFPETNYFWLTYDISSTAACDPARVDAQCTSVTVAGIARTPTVTSPLGSRIINCGTPYYSKGNLAPNILTSWSSTRDGSGASPASFASGSEFYVQYGHTMTSTAAVTLPVLYVENGGHMRAAQNCLISVTDLRINTGGTFTQFHKAGNGTYITNFYIENGGTWIHDNNGSLPSGGRFFEPRSNQWFLQWGAGTFPSGTNWGNVLLNGTTTGNFGMQNCLNDIQGDFEWRRIGNNNYLLDGATETINIGGNLIFSGGWWVGAGGTSGGGKTLTLNVTGDYIVSKGTHEDMQAGTNSASNTQMTIGGNVLITGGTIKFNNCPNALSRINMSGGIPLATWTQTGGTVNLSHVNIKTGKTVTLAGSKLGDVGTDRIVTVESGAALYCATFPVVGGGQFAIQANARLGMGHASGYNGNIALTGTKTNDAGADFIYYLGNAQNSGTFTTTAGAGSTIDPWRLRSVTVDKTAGSAVTLQQPLRVTGAVTSFTAPSGVTVANNLQLINGLLTTTQANVIEVDAGATANAGSATSFVNGPITKKGTTGFIFPTGKVDATNVPRWARIETGAPSAAVDFRAEYFPVGYGNYTVATQVATLQLDHVSSLEYWMLDRVTGSANCTGCTQSATVRLYWQNATWSQVYKCDSLNIARFNGTAWENTGASVTPCTYGAAGLVGMSNTVTAFSPFTLSSRGIRALNPLPINLLSFTAVPQENEVRLVWSTASELGNDYFEIERTADGETFETIGRVQGAGNSNKVLHYHTYDQRPLSGKSYYRLVQTDYDGKQTRSELVAIEMAPRATAVITPNPSRTRMELLYYSEIEGDAVVKIYDVTGKLVHSSNYYVTKGNNTIPFEVSNYTVGLYNLTVTQQDQVIIRKFLKEQ